MRPDRILELPPPPPELEGLSQRLGRRIVERIAAQGPLPFADYMAMALYEPGLGYYVNGLHKFGAAGDFVTAPEQGSLFAAALARQCERITAGLGPDWTLLEPGAGSGALARDLLTALENPPRRYLILEPSAALRQVQAETLAALPQPLQSRVEWLAAPPDQAFEGIILANEVLDALPVACFEVVAAGVVERCVDVAGDRLVWVTRPAPPRLTQAVDALLARLPGQLPVGYRSEICLDLPGWIETISAPLSRGAMLLIDYGYPITEYYHPQRHEGTLVCHYRHRAHFDPFVWPGLTDLSAFVDFSAVAEAGVAAGLSLAGFTSQAGFILGSGAHELLEQSEDEPARLRLAAELKRLTLPGEMGEKFKLIGFSRDLDVDWPGFALIDQLHRL